MKCLCVILFLILQSCTANKCHSVDEVKIKSSLLMIASSLSYDYCGLLEKSMKKDKKAIVNLSLLYFDGESAYNHGYVLVQLVSLIGENEYLEAIKNVSNKDKELIDIYLRVGIEYGEFLMGYGESKFKNSTLDQEFPVVAKFLEN